MFAAIAGLISELFIPAAIGAFAYSSVKSARTQEKAVEAQEEYYEAQIRSAGEYRELTKQQMEMQAQESNIVTLSKLIEQRSRPPQQQVLTTPVMSAAYSIVDRINIAIGNLMAG